MRSPLVLVQLSLTFLLLHSNVIGCVLMPKPTVLDDYQNSDVVIIVRAVSQEKTSKPSGLTNNRVVTTTMEIEKVFKGNFRVGDKLTLGQMSPPACGWEFYDSDIGQQYLLYLGSPEKGSKLWYVYGNDRSQRLSYAADDLLYFNKLDAVRGKTRVSGTLDRDNDEPDVVGRKIWLMGNDRVYETKTDKDGVYEFYDLPPGRYVLQPELPAGWRIDREPIGTTTISDKKRQIRNKQVVFTLKPRQHAAIDMSFVLDNVVSGSVVNAQGKPLPEVQVSLLPTDGKQSLNFEYTDEEGRFAIESIEPGSYVLVVNEDGEKRIQEPLPALYYPDVAEKANARVFRIRAGDSIKGLKIVVPKVEEMVTVEGVVRFADGTPAPKVTARFNTRKVPGVDGDNIGDTDAKGRFSFKIFKGLPGELHADFFAMLESDSLVWLKDGYVNCPQVQRLIKQSGEDRTMIKTPTLRIDPQGDLRNLVLTFPFPACKRNPLTRK